MTSSKFLGVLVPFITHSRNLSVLFVTHWVAPSPLERDVIYGWPLIEKVNLMMSASLKAEVFSLPLLPIEGVGQCEVGVGRSAARRRRGQQRGRRRRGVVVRGRRPEGGLMPLLGSRDLKFENGNILLKKASRHVITLLKIPPPPPSTEEEAL